MLNFCSFSSISGFEKYKHRKDNCKLDKKFFLPSMQKLFFVLLRKTENIHLLDLRFENKKLKTISYL